MKHTNTQRETIATVTGSASHGVGVKFQPDGITPDLYTMHAEEAVALAEALLKAAGVKFKITLNA